MPDEFYFIDEDMCKWLTYIEWHNVCTKMTEMLPSYFCFIYNDLNFGQMTNIYIMT
jgi:hypothetical protein